MEAYVKNLGRTCIECCGIHSKNNKYKKGSIIYTVLNEEINSYISRQDVPSGIDLFNEFYWQPIGVTLEYV